MIISKQNIFENSFHYDAICVPTSGTVTASNKLVMGVGITKKFKDKYPGLDLELGEKIKIYGNIPFLVYKSKQPIISFPISDNYKEKANLEIIKKSAQSLVKIASSRYWTKIALPAPGVGTGGLSWSKDVYPVLSRVLDDRFHILFKEK